MHLVAPMHTLSVYPENAPGNCCAIISIMAWKATTCLPICGAITAYRSAARTSAASFSRSPPVVCTAADNTAEEQRQQRMAAEDVQYKMRSRPGKGVDCLCVCVWEKVGGASMQTQCTFCWAAAGKVTEPVPLLCMQLIGVELISSHGEHK